MVYQDMEEDFPHCHMETTKSCTNSTNKDVLSNPEEDCSNVEVRRCRIAKRKVRKAQPETRCERVPVKTCAVQKCEKDGEKCEERVGVLREWQPEEVCELVPRRVCQEGSDCTSSVRRVCTQLQGGTVKTHLLCNGTLQETP